MQLSKITWREKCAELQKLRHQVFVQEQSVDLREEFDGLDELDDTHHFAAYTEKGDLVGCARLLAGGKISRMAVSPEHRHQGIGHLLLAECVSFALRECIVSEDGAVFLHAQTQAKKFYEKSGFIPVGELFYEAGIEHITMVLHAENAQSIAQIMRDKIWRFQSVDDIHFHFEQFCKITSRDIHILSGHLDSTLYEHQNFLHAFSKMARKSRNSQIRILLRDSRQLHGKRHTLIELAQKLSSKIEIRRLTEEPQNPDDAYFISDNMRLCYFNNENRYAGFSNYCAAPEAQHILEEFKNLWHRHSETDPDLSQICV